MCVNASKIAMNIYAIFFLTDKIVSNNLVILLDSHLLLENKSSWLAIPLWVRPRH